MTEASTYRLVEGSQRTRDGLVGKGTLARFHIHGRDIFVLADRLGKVGIGDLTDGTAEPVAALVNTGAGAVFSARRHPLDGSGMSEITSHDRRPED